MQKRIRVVYVNRAIGPFRIPVLVHLNRLLDGDLTAVFSQDITQTISSELLRTRLGQNAIGLIGEKKVFNWGKDKTGLANKNLKLFYQPGLFKLLRKLKPDVIITESFSQWSIPVWLYRLIYKTPVIVGYQRTHHTERHAQWYRRLFRKLALKITGAVCCNGSLSVEYLKSLGLSPKKIFPGAHGINHSDFAADCSTITEEDRKALRRKHDMQGTTFTYVGRLIELKGISQLLDGWKRLGSDLSKCTLVIVGDGPEKERLQQKVLRESIDSVRFIERVPNNLLYRYYAASDVFVIPTLEDNWSVVVMEAMACGLPVISSVYNGSTPDLVQVGVNGFHVDPFNPENLADAMRHFLDNQESIKGMSDQSSIIIRNYSSDNVAAVMYKACRFVVRVD